MGIIRPRERQNPTSSAVIPLAVLMLTAVAAAGERRGAIDKGGGTARDPLVESEIRFARDLLAGRGG